MGGEGDSESESQPPKKKKYTGAYKFKTQPKPEWFTGKYKDVIKPPQMDCYSVYCIICQKDGNVSHQGFKDIDRHCEGRNHVDKLSSIRSQQPIQIFFVKKRTKMFLSFFCHLESLIRVSFPDSKCAQTYSMGKPKATCILNGAIAPDLQSSLVEKMKSAVYSLATDGSNDQNLEKMNPLTVRYFDEPQHKVVTQFLGMYLSRSSTAEDIFSSLNVAPEKHNIPWSNCIALGVDNTSVNVGKHKSIIVEARKKNPEIKLMGCPCRIAHNTAQYATWKFEEIINGFKRKFKSDGEKQKKPQKMVSIQKKFW